MRVFLGVALVLLDFVAAAANLVCSIRGVMDEKWVLAAFNGFVACLCIGGAVLIFTQMVIEHRRG